MRLGYSRHHHSDMHRYDLGEACSPTVGNGVGAACGPGGEGCGDNDVGTRGPRGPAKAVIPRSYGGFRVKAIAQSLSA